VGDLVNRLGLLMALRLEQGKPDRFGFRGVTFGQISDYHHVRHIPPDRRFILRPQLDREPLVDAGMIDSSGRLDQRKWTRVVRDECIKGGWGYAPRKVTVELSPELKAELKALQEKTVTESGTTARKQRVVSQPQASGSLW
jgi:hypothetical protein